MLRSLVDGYKTDFQRRVDQYLQERKLRIYQRCIEANAVSDSVMNTSADAAPQPCADFETLLQQHMARRKQKIAANAKDSITTAPLVKHC